MSDYYTLSYKVPRSYGHVFADLMESTAKAVNMSIDESEENIEIEAIYQSRPRKNVLTAVNKLAQEFFCQRLNLILKSLPDEDWLDKTRRDFRPVYVPPFYVTNSLHDTSKIWQRHKLNIDASQAFGTGYHATTSLCLKALNSLRGQLKPEHVLDMGCGTGILGMAAARIWPTKAYLFDIDPKAIKICQDNIKKNGLCHSVVAFVAKGYHGWPKRRFPKKYALITANILPNPLCEMSKQQAHFLAKGGRLILSGLQRSHLRRVFAAYQRFGLKIKRVYEKDSWLSVVLCKL